MGFYKVNHYLNKLQRFALFILFYTDWVLQGKSLSEQTTKICSVHCISHWLGSTRLIIIWTNYKDLLCSLYFTLIGFYKVNHYLNKLQRFALFILFYTDWVLQGKSLSEQTTKICSVHCISHWLGSTRLIIIWTNYKDLLCSLYFTLMGFYKVNHYLNKLQRFALFIVFHTDWVLQGKSLSEQTTKICSVHCISHWLGSTR